MVPFHYWELRALDQWRPTFWGQAAKFLLARSGRVSEKSHFCFHPLMSRHRREGYERDSLILIADLEHIKFPEDISPFAKDTDNQLVAQVSPQTGHSTVLSGHLLQGDGKHREMREFCDMSHSVLYLLLNQLFDQKQH